MFGVDARCRVTGERQPALGDRHLTLATTTHRCCVTERQATGVHGRSDQRRARRGWRKSYTGSRNDSAEKSTDRDAAGPHRLRPAPGHPGPRGTRVEPSSIDEEDHHDGPPPGRPLPPVPPRPRRAAARRAGAARRRPPRPRPDHPPPPRRLDHPRHRGLPLPRQRLPRVRLPQPQRRPPPTTSEATASTSTTCSPPPPAAPTSSGSAPAARAGAPPAIHQGRSGWRVNDYLDRTWNDQSGRYGGERGLEEWLGLFDADVALVLLGTNDLGRGESATQTIEELETLIDRLFAANANTELFLAAIPPIVGWNADHRYTAPYSATDVGGGGRRLRRPARQPRLPGAGGRAPRHPRRSQQRLLRQRERAGRLPRGHGRGPRQHEPGDLLHPAGHQRHLDPRRHPPRAARRALHRRALPRRARGGARHLRRRRRGAGHPRRRSPRSPPPRPTGRASRPTPCSAAPRRMRAARASSGCAWWCATTTPARRGG